MSKEIVRKRKPAARRSDVIIALLEDRLEMIEEKPDAVLMHKAKLLELFDELRRSLNLGKNADSGEGE